MAVAVTKRWGHAATGPERFPWPDSEPAEWLDLAGRRGRLWLFQEGFAAIVDRPQRLDHSSSPADGLKPEA